VQYALISPQAARDLRSVDEGEVSGMSVSVRIARVAAVAMFLGLACDGPSLEKDFFKQRGPREFQEVVTGRSQRGTGQRRGRESQRLTEC